ncbi:MAG: hypothetical protein FJ403_22125 [Verrucomicrobia bacterium]|nr:hypothetical protein [Verrucomicrobiota bacterium]
MEEVEVYLQIDHKARGQLEAYLTSPGGTRSRMFARVLKEKAAEDKRAEKGVDWWFTGNAFWGENPAGDWTLTVRDTETGETGTWKSFELRVRMGQLIPAARPTPPAIASFSPNNGAVGTIVTITGTKLNGTASVKFNGVSATFTEKSSTQLAATVPTGAATGPISVTTASGTAASTANFTVSAAPAITSFVPTGSAVGGTVTIIGANFTGATEVRFNGLIAVFKVNSPTQITATVPAGATTGRISLTTPAGDDASSINFVVTLAPTIGSFTPTTGVAGTTVVILGANFTAATAVRFNNLNATAFTVNSANQITVTAPAGVSTGAISVTRPAAPRPARGRLPSFPRLRSAGFHPVRLPSEAGLSSAVIISVGLRPSDSAP